MGRGKHKFRKGELVTLRVEPGERSFCATAIRLHGYLWVVTHVYGEVSIELKSIATGEERGFYPHNVIPYTGEQDAEDA